MSKFLGDEVLHALWRQLSSEQRVALLALRHGCCEDITLGDVRYVRTALPEGRRPSIGLQQAPMALADYVAREMVANDREALR